MSYRYRLSKNKYGAKKTTVDGIEFDSKREALRYKQLCLLRRAGTINRLKLQPRFTLQEAFTDRNGDRQRAIVYVGDFEYYEGNQRVVEDVKGVETKVFAIKKKMFLKNFPDIDLRIV